jgi:hypothetical protein
LISHALIKNQAVSLSILSIFTHLQVPNHTLSADMFQGETFEGLVVGLDFYA